MVKKKTIKKSAKKVSKKKTKIKHEKPKKKIHKLKNQENIGFKIAILFGVIIFIAYGYLLFETTYNTKSAFAEGLSEETRFMLNYYQSDIEASLDGDYDDVLEDDYLESMKSEFEWLEKKELEAYNSMPRNEVEYKEAAIYLFIDNILSINEMTIIDFGEPNYSKEIEDAKNNVFETPSILSDEDLDQLAFSREELEKIESYFNELTESYIKEKRFILESSESEERKFVEAKKISYLSYLDSE